MPDISDGDGERGRRRLLAAAVFLLVPAAYTSTAGRPAPGRAQDTWPERASGSWASIAAGKAARQLGGSDKFDQAVADFAENYADQTERDHTTLADAVASGRVQAQVGI